MSVARNSVLPANSIFGIIITGFMEPHDLAVCSMLATKQSAEEQLQE